MEAPELRVRTAEDTWGPSGKKRRVTSATAAVSATSHSPSEASTSTPPGPPRGSRSTALMLGWQDRPRSSSCVHLPAPRIWSLQDSASFKSTV